MESSTKSRLEDPDGLWARVNKGNGKLGMEPYTMIFKRLIGVSEGQG